MRTILKLYLIGMAFVLMAFKVADVVFPEQKEVVALEKQLVIKPISITSEKIEVKNHEAFLDAIGHRESSNRYHIVNRLGYMGKYQFSKHTLKLLDIDVTRKEFLNSPNLQEEAMDKLLTENAKTLRRIINKYEGEVVHGVYITESGVLAAAHLGGAGNVKKWFRRGVQFKDANGTSITNYMKVFSGYSLDLE